MTGEVPSRAHSAPPQAPREAQRRRPPIWVWLIVASLAMLIAAIVFATIVYLLPAENGADAPTATPSTTKTQPSPTQTSEPPAPAPAPAPIVLPSCETLWPERYAISKAYAESYPSEILFDDIGDYRFADRFGPAAQTALSQATQLRSCVYVTNSETFIQASTSELKGAPKEALIAALRADGDFVESTLDGAQVFEWKKQENGHWDYTITTHSFIGDVWIAGFGPQPAADYVPQLSAAILAANPTMR